MDAQSALARALSSRTGPEPALLIEEARSEAWASATFTGARHHFRCSLKGRDAAEAASRLAGRLDAMEFNLPGHLVADIAMLERRDTEEGSTLAIEALTVEEC